MPLATAVALAPLTDDDAVAILVEAGVNVHLLIAEGAEVPPERGEGMRVALSGQRSPQRAAVPHSLNEFPSRR